MIPRDGFDPLLMAAMFRLDLAAPDEVVDWAASHVEEVNDEHLVELASLPSPSRADVQDLLDALLMSAGSGRVDDERAASLISRAILRDMVEGRSAPYEGSSLLWWRVARRVPQIEPLLRPMIGLASEWEDDPAAREDYERDMLITARALLEDGEIDLRSSPRG